MNAPTRHVITGGPGVGKTTTLELLAKQGFTTVPESARDVIAAQQRAGAEGLLPWTDFIGFQYLVLDEQLRRERAASGNPVFLDRGVIDALAYCRVFDKPIPDALALHARADRYGHVFLLDQLSHYATDMQRKEDPQTARKLHEAIGDAYRLVGYRVTRVPAIAPEARVALIIAQSVGTAIRKRIA
jgi:predicted ATPase